MYYSFKKYFFCYLAQVTICSHITLRRKHPKCIFFVVMVLPSTMGHIRSTKSMHRSNRWVCVKQVWLVVQRNLSSINYKLLLNSVLFVQESILCSPCQDAAQARESGAARAVTALGIRYCHADKNGTANKSSWRG